MTIGPTRRTVLVTGSAVLIASCSEYGDEKDSGSDSVTPEKTSRAPGGEALTTTAEIPEGGGKIFKDRKVVVTQPEKGEFKAFSAVCTHQGCIVSSVAEGTIDCACHNSKFRIEDGSVAKGPATRPLPEEQITVAGGSIRLT
ncbi:Rieske (2Fe-2S) protein [Streptomyces cavernae]|uniref:Rieske (2Fe-2S) protein n=1 Tax=Streptomyces cavernae TaxID=2259034 RepID=UPI000FEBA026|nr:Rieske (2Fe-2S) protein [Streptomyces cavernae]